MKVVFVSNFFNHHQKPFSDEMYNLTNKNYTFIALEKIPQERIDLGYEDLSSPYLFKIVDSESYHIGYNMILEADACIVGDIGIHCIRERIKRKKLTFFYSERLFKQFPSIFFYLKNIARNYYYFGLEKNVYLLAAGAYVKKDFNYTMAFFKKSLKWGYFPELKIYNNNEFLYKKNLNKINLLWAGRFLEWKHPEYAIYVAKKLYDHNISFDMKIIGNGSMYNMLDELIKKNKLSHCVHLLTGYSPKMIRDEMEIANIFLFTSDRNEGWGAVLNEAMNSGCIVIADEMIGAVPYLIQNGYNGFKYKTKDKDDLLACVFYVLNLSKDDCKTISLNAYDTIVKNWNSKVAANNLFALANALLEGKKYIVNEGPCSIAQNI